MEIQIKAVISGLVQGVGYRYFCYKKALEYNIRGFAKNLVNGDVEVEAEGDKNLIKDFVRELKRGPMNSRVKSISVEEFPFENKFTEFKI